MQHPNINGRQAADKLIDKIAHDVVTFKNKNWFPKLVPIKVGADKSVDLYVRNQKRSADKVGIEFIERHYPASISTEEVTAAITHPNVDPSVKGIIRHHMHFHGNGLTNDHIGAL